MNKSPMYVCMYSTHTRVSDRALSPSTYASFAFPPLLPPPPLPATQRLILHQSLVLHPPPLHSRHFFLHSKTLLFHSLFLGRFDPTPITFDLSVSSPVQPPHTIPRHPCKHL